MFENFWHACKLFDILYGIIALNYDRLRNALYILRTDASLKGIKPDWKLGNKKEKIKLKDKKYATYKYIRQKV